MEYGCPPHAGIAFGLDRIVMLLRNLSSIRDTIAFPKTQSSSCLLTEAPTEIDLEQLKELAIKTNKVKDMIESNYKKRLDQVKTFLDINNAKLISHYYVDSEIQRLTEDTGGCVADSLQMAKFGTQQKEKNLIIAGVRFMGETAKILNPEKIYTF